MTRPILSAAIALAALSGPALADPVKVSAANFIRAETDTYMGGMVATNGLGKLVHIRTPTSIDNQTIIRMNLDTLYSSAVYDLAAGPVTLSIPKVTDGRYLAVQVVTQDHFTPVVLHDGTHTLTQDSVGTRYVALLVRTFMNPADPDDLDKAHALQDAIKVEQAAPGTWEVPAYDKTSLDGTRNALLALAALGTDGMTPRMGPKGSVNAVGHLLATAGGWGLNPETEAVYKMGFPTPNDAATVQSITFKDVPVDGFWSITVYNAKGFMEKNDLGVNALNSVTAKAGPDGAHTIQFGGCAPTVANCIPVMDGWNYTIRLYRPRAEVQNGTWVAPVPAPVK
jgi:hypothetical protein